jgi:phospholipid/cholesterol/gamma-HCH transport system permease protein
MSVAAIDLVQQPGVLQLRLSGDWTLATMPQPIVSFERRLRELATGNPAWDLQSIARLDSAGGILLWRAWGQKWPASLAISTRHRAVIARIELMPVEQPSERPTERLSLLLAAGRPVLAAASHFTGLVALIGQLILDLLYLCRHPGDIPWREFSANLFKSGAQALPVTALIGFLIGIVLSYLSALQLANFGADVFIVNLLGISIVRELGPVLVAVLVAGRSGSAMTAQIGRFAKPAPGFAQGRCALGGDATAGALVFGGRDRRRHGFGQSADGPVVWLFH